VLTPAGRDLAPVLAALAGWGMEHVPVDARLPYRFVDRDTDAPAGLGFVDADGRPIPPAQVVLQRR
jgi:hypothetical protein